MRKLHRQLAVFAMLVGLFISLTGLIIQSMDLTAILRHAPAGDPTMQGIRAGIYGPPNFKVIRDEDFEGRPLPAGFDFDSGLASLVTAARAKLGSAPLGYVELRAIDGSPVGVVAARGMLYSFDLATGTSRGEAEKLVFSPISTPSLRNRVKDVHRMRWFGRWGVAVDILAGLLMCGAIITGLAFYIQLWRARAKMKRKAVFWFAGDWWRTLHRGLATVAALFLLLIALTGTVLATSSLGVSVYTTLYGPERPGMSRDLSSPLADGQLPAMLHTTLAAQREADAAAPIKAVRLRFYAGMPQGVVVAGASDTRQRAFNAVTGRRVSFTEAGYPATGQTFGWQVDETFKEIHRGDMIGLTGQWISLLAGLALLYLSVSGAKMYLDLYKRRRARGRKELFWS